jgi:hypothetical protein
VLRVVEVRRECELAAGRLRQARGTLPRDSLRRAEIRVDALDTASNQRLAEPELKSALEAEVQYKFFFSCLLSCSSAPS